MGYFAFFIVCTIIVALILNSTLKTEKEKILREAKAEREATLLKARNNADGITREARVEYQKTLELKTKTEKELREITEKKERERR